MTPTYLAPLLLSFLLSFSLQTCAAPTDPSSAGLTISLRMNPLNTRSVDELAALAWQQRQNLIFKYGHANQKRSSGYNLIVNQGQDSVYFGSLAIGTPLTSFDVVLDTGSSDMLVAGNTCGTTCKGVTMFNPSSSSTFNNLTNPFFIQYGSGSAAGYIAQDVVVMAGFSVANQGFAVVDQVSTGLLTSGVSGILGLGWERLSSSGQTPFWQILANDGAMDSALFAIQLRRYTNASNPSQFEPGGQLTFGYTNSSLYSGEIEYINIPGTPSYWYLPFASLTVQGTSISLGSGVIAAIDTGTTNIAGPSSAVEAIYAQIPNSSPASGQWDGYYQYPCSTKVDVTFSFGGTTWTMSSVDFVYAQISSSQCIGAFFNVATSSASTPSWIIGAAFLKNVYSVFRFNPPAVGFAALSAVAIAQNGVNGPAPTPTIGTVTAAVTNVSAALPRVRLGLGHGVLQGIVGLLAMSTVMWTL